MNSTDIIELIGIGITFILGVGSAIFSVLSNNKSKEANKIAKEALELSKSINKKNMENITVQTTKNTVIVKQSENIKIKEEDEKDYSDFYLILNLRINNNSFQAVTINDMIINIGKANDETSYFRNDLVNVISYKEFDKVVKLKNVNEFPYYLKANQSEEITIVLGIEETDRLLFLANGAKISLKTANNNYSLQIKSANTLEY